MSVRLVNIGREYPLQIHPDRKSCEIDLIHNMHSKFCTGHGSTPAIRCTKISKLSNCKIRVMDKRNFARFEFDGDILWCNSPKLCTIGTKQSLRPRKWIVACKLLWNTHWRKWGILDIDAYQLRKLCRSVSNLNHYKTDQYRSYL